MPKPKNRSSNSKDKGVTIIELLFVLAIGAFLISGILSAWYFVYKNWAVEDIKLQQRASLQTAMEWIKHETRLSSLTYACYYPPEPTNILP